VSWRTTRAAGRTAQSIRQVAVVDLGSNSWRLVVFSYAPGSWWKLTDELYETVRIGAGLGSSGQLSFEAMERGRETLSVFQRFCRAEGLSAEPLGHEQTLRDAERAASDLTRLLVAFLESLGADARR